MTTATLSLSATRAAAPVKPRRLGVRAAKLTVGLVVLAAVLHLDIGWSDLAELPADLRHYLDLMFAHPDWSRLPAAFYQTWVSVSMAWVGAVLGVVASTILGIPAAQGVAPLWVRLPLRGLFAVLRAVPEVIIAIILLTVTGLTPFTGALALAVGGIGTHGKWTYETIEAVPAGTAEAVRAAGGNVLEVARWGLWPAAAPELMSLALYRFEINVRTSAILGLIGVGGVGDMLTGYTQYRQWDSVGVLIIVVIAVTMTIDAISGAIRRRIMRGARARDLDRTV
ncbi:phosphonate ABC transporter, permease protein PhnE [Isoptericola sp. b441]|uniref:Phosphonate ABC transporter, permease protein PhnE n=1 Tax=Actinotalea lenta TaxID=3064654 RepID=A0ABT9D9X0_9CELL|nr:MULTISPECIES: phosphonate ABC transporter, permease protein PhnE [unclassified Isoptericola]MDO8107703.1 phosphonate ABC transporter, permease protein PhnE [Isoptericola sp. b441]MDO8120626.1 phosphonate ABC transporter, permease protein PhnE [Isoptericola sp. b490]